MAYTISKLDRTQSERAAIETLAGRSFVVRFVITCVVAGTRILAGACQGRNTFETPEEAVAWLQAARQFNSRSTLESVYGDLDKVQVRAVACYPKHHDPLGVYFDSDEENPELFIFAAAFDVWQGLTTNQRGWVRHGVFPQEPMERALVGLRDVQDAERRLCVALMGIAAQRGGISLAGLSRVTRRREVTRA